MLLSIRPIKNSRLHYSMEHKGSLPHARPFDTPGTSFIGVHMRAYACHRRVMGLHMNIIGVHMHIIGVHMHIIGVHTRANKIRARRAKVRACGRPAFMIHQQDSNIS